MKISSGEDWDFDKIDEVYMLIKQIADEKYGLDYYPNQLEVISSEQMIDAYSSAGLPLYYSHWSFGQQFVRELDEYKRGRMGLAYEIVINSDPCIAYLMEENTMLMQTLVMAHASFGHNHFFKNNYLFKQWTHPNSIINYLDFAKKFIQECEDIHGVAAVEEVLDAAHALQDYGVDKYNHPAPLSPAKEEKLRKERDDYIHSQLNVIWNTIPNDPKIELDNTPTFPKQPQENILHFIEQNAPRLEDWKREVIRIVRNIAQYFFPQKNTSLMNEGCATFFHYKLVHDLYDQGVLDDGAMLEFYTSHTGVVKQLGFNDRGFSGINVYALGFAMYKDIERISMNPTDEDREWFDGQDWVGNGKWLDNIKWAITNFKDESFVKQFLSPAIIREFRMFAIHDDALDSKYLISGIHNKQGYVQVRDTLSKQYNIGYRVPDIQVVNVDRWGTRGIKLQHRMVNGRPLDKESAVDTLRCISFLWGYSVELESIDDEGVVQVIFNITENNNVEIHIMVDDELE